MAQNLHMQFAPCKPCPSADGTGEGRPTTWDPDMPPG